MRRCPLHPTWLGCRVGSRLTPPFCDRRLTMCLAPRPRACEVVKTAPPLSVRFPPSPHCPFEPGMRSRLTPGAGEDVRYGGDVIGIHAALVLTVAVGRAPAHRRRPSQFLRAGVRPRGVRLPVEARLMRLIDQVTDPVPDPTRNSRRRPRRNQPSTDPLWRHASTTQRGPPVTSRRHTPSSEAEPLGSPQRATWYRRIHAVSR